MGQHRILGRILVLMLGGTLVLLGYILPRDLYLIRAIIISSGALIGIWGYLFAKYGGQLRLCVEVLISLGHSLQFLLPAPYLALRIAQGHPLDEFGLVTYYPDVGLATFVAQCLFFLGYSRVTLKQSNLGLQIRNRLTLQVFLLVVAGVVWLTRFILLINGAYYWAYVSDFVFTSRWASILGQVSGYGIMIPVLLFATAWVTKEHKYRMGAGVSILLELIWHIPSGAREAIVRIPLTLLIAYWVTRRKLPFKSVIVLTLLGLVVLGPLHYYRYAIAQYTRANQLGFDATVKAMQDISASRGALNAGGSPVDELMNRLFDGKFLAMLFRDYHEIYPFEFGGTYQRCIYIFLPKFIYPNRPIAQIPINIWFPSIQAGGSSPLTFLGEAYINFGILGLLFVPLAVGILCGIYDKIFLYRMDRLSFFLGYTVIGFEVTRLTVQTLSVWLGVFRNGILIALLIQLLLHLTGRLVRHSASSHAPLVRASQSLPYGYRSI
ncbi:hypothetical protein HYR99_04085 [Candidatus Poribacteria bacterium]|nr:hypothetical protein [Candidatus Poribacteria bacterium]